jgi:hypothetical protein
MISMKNHNNFNVFNVSLWSSFSEISGFKLLFRRSKEMHNDPFQTKFQFVHINQCPCFLYSIKLTIGFSFINLAVPLFPRYNLSEIIQRNCPKLKPVQ